MCFDKNTFDPLTQCWRYTSADSHRLVEIEFRFLEEKRTQTWITTQIQENLSHRSLKDKMRERERESGHYGKYDKQQATFACLWPVG